jgi:hypothetical protein
VVLADEIIANHRWPRGLLLRARAQVAAGQDAAALQTLIVIAEQSQAQAPLRAALAIARGIPELPETATLRAHALKLLRPRPARRGRPPA